MPTYRITDNVTGKQYDITGDSPPTEEELTQIFGVVSDKKESLIDKAKSALSPATQFSEKPIEGILPLVGALAGGVAGTASPVPGGAAIGGAGGYYAGKQAERALQGKIGTPSEQVKDITEAATQEVGGKLAGDIVAGVAGKIKPYAKNLYESAMKPSTTLTEKAREKIVKTGLENEIPVSKKGFEKAKKSISEINNEIKSTIENATGITINVDRTLQPVAELGSKVQATKIDSASDLLTIAKFVDDIQTSQPANIPIQQAQKFKQTLNKELNEYYAAYSKGKLTPPGVYQKSQAALADGLRNEITELYPVVGTLNAKEGALIELNKSLGRAINRIRNREIIPLLAGIAAGTASTNGVLKAIALKAVEHPEVKSKLAIAINKANINAMRKSTKTAVQAGLAYYNKDREGENVTGR